MKIFKKFTILLLIGLLVFSCSRNKKKIPLDKQILAKVGDRVITASEFRYSYEFSFAPLRHGVSQRRTYLDYMIKELLLANEGYRLGYNKNVYVTSRVANRTRNDLLESFYLKHVHGKVNIPEEKLQDAIKKGSVKWRMIIWPVANLHDAEEALAEARKSNLEDFIEKKIASEEVQLKEKKFFETGWVDYLDLRPEVFEKIKDLEVGKVSEPIPYGTGYALAQILDMNLEGIKSVDLQFGARRKNMYARLHDIEADKIVHNLMDSIITPLDVRVKGRVVEDLAPPLYQFVRNGLPDISVLNYIQNAPDSAEAYTGPIRDMLGTTLLTYQHGKRTVEDYLQYMNYYRKTIDQATSFEDFKARLITEIGTMIKNEIFIDIAKQDGFLDSSRITKDLRVWEQKWTYDAFRYDLTKKLDVSDDEMQDFWKHRWRELEIANVDTTRFYKYKNSVHNFILHEKHIALINKKLTELKKRYPVWINEKLLDELELSDGPKTQQTSLFIRKNFSGEPIVPIADMKWIHF